VAAQEHKENLATRELIMAVIDNMLKCAEALRPLVIQRWGQTSEGQAGAVAVHFEFCSFFLFHVYSIATRLYGKSFGEALDAVVRPAVLKTTADVLYEGYPDEQSAEPKRRFPEVLRDRYSRYGACTSYQLTLQQDPIINPDRTAIQPRSRVNMLALNITMFCFGGRFTPQLYSAVLEAVPKSMNNTNFERLLAIVKEATQASNPR
jgi:hypothetical protein